MSVKVSARRYLGVGRVAENKKRGSDMIEVYPREQLPTVDDDITPTTQKVKYQGIDCGERPYAVELERGFTIPCKWIGETNRSTAPDVRRGERVDIYQDGDSQSYYWDSRGQDDNLRRLETVIYTISANPENSNTDPDGDNTWSMIWDSHEGHITLRTTMLNNEKAAWTLMFDCANGTFVIEDEKGMHWFKDSVNDIMRMQNQNKTKIELNKKNIDIFAEEKITINAKNMSTFIQELIEEKAKNIQTTVEEMIKTKVKDINTESDTTTWNNSNSWSLETGTWKTQAQQSAELKAGSTVTIQGSNIFLN